MKKSSAQKKSQIQVVKSTKSNSSTRNKSAKPVTVKNTKLSKNEREKIILENQEFGLKLAWSFISNWRVRMTKDEIKSSVGIALVDAARRFDKDKGASFRTFFYYYLRGVMLKEVSEMIESQKLYTVDEELTGLESINAVAETTNNLRKSLIEKNNPESLLLKRQKALLCWDACKSLDPLEQEVIVRTYVNGESLIDISKDLNYCRCHISRVKSSALAKLGDFLKPEMQEADQVLTKAANKLSSYKGGRGRRAGMVEEETYEGLKKVIDQYRVA